MKEDKKLRLNLVGNGFDLYHGLPCSYYYFGCFMADKYYSFYEEMSEMFGFCCKRYHGFLKEKMEIVVEDIFWKTFEEGLGKIDTMWLEDSLTDDLGLEYPDDPVDIEIPEVANAQVIIEKFCEWISTTVNTKNNFRTIKKMISSSKLKFEKSDYFINFNYTQTLEKIYGITYDKIFHIHGECDIDFDETDNLIVGHGNKDAIYDLEETIENIENKGYYLSDQGVRNRLNEYKAELHILKKLRKNVDGLIVEMSRNILSKEIVPDEIWVWGLSCGEVDKPYVSYLRETFPNAEWKFSYYNNDEKLEREKLAKEMGIKQGGYFCLNNINAPLINRALVKINNIVEYEKI